MREIKINKIGEVNIEFNIVNQWYSKNVDDTNKLFPKFMKINDMYPVGEMREAAYIALMIEEIRAAGLYNKFASETQTVIQEATALWNKYNKYLGGLDKRCAAICNAANAVVDAESLERFKHVYTTNEDLPDGPGPTTKPSLHWLREQIAARKGQQHKLEGTGQTYTFLTKEEILDFIDEAIRRP